MTAEGSFRLQARSTLLATNVDISEYYSFIKPLKFRVASISVLIRYNITYAKEKISHSLVYEIFSFVAADV